jgi:hypothetical protein
VKYPLGVIVFIATITLQLEVHAQPTSGKVLARVVYDNDAQPIVMLKWYTNQMFYEQGVHVYKRILPDGDWSQISSIPIQTTDPLSVENEDYRGALEIANNYLSDRDDMIKLDLLMMSFHDDELAVLFGLAFRDTNVITGVSYEYKVEEIMNKSTRLIGKTQIQVKGDFYPTLFKEFEVWQDGKNVAIDWQFEEELFYAVDILRSHNGESPSKVNRNPVVNSLKPDSTGKMVYPSPKYLDIMVEPGVTYQYQLIGYGYFENDSIVSIDRSLTLQDLEAPPPPQNLTAMVDSMVVTLTWTNPPDSTYQRIQILRSNSSDGPFSTIAEDQFKNSFSDSLSDAGHYYYKVKAVDSLANEAYSVMTYAEVMDVIPPQPPKGLVIEQDTGILKLNWSGPERDVEGYLIFKGLSENTDFVLLNSDPLNESKIELTYPKNVKGTWYFYVISVDEAGNRSRRSETIKVQLPDFLPPQTPRFKHIEPHAEYGILLSWYNNIDSDLKGYQLLRSEDRGKVKSLHEGYLEPTATKYHDEEALPNISYTYYLLSMDSADNKSSYDSIHGYYKLTFNSEYDLDFQVKRTSKLTRLSWNVPDRSVGSVVLEGKSPDHLIPISGLIDQPRFKDQRRDSSFYQVRVYFPDGLSVHSEVVSSWR